MLPHPIHVISYMCTYLTYMCVCVGDVHHRIQYTSDCYNIAITCMDLRKLVLPFDSEVASTLAYASCNIILKVSCELFRPYVQKSTIQYIICAVQRFIPNALWNNIGWQYIVCDIEHIVSYVNCNIKCVSCDFTPSCCCVLTGTH